MTTAFRSSESGSEARLLQRDIRVNLSFAHPIAKSLAFASYATKDLVTHYLSHGKSSTPSRMCNGYRLCILTLVLVPCSCFIGGMLAQRRVLPALSGIRLARYGGVRLGGVL